MQQIMGWMIAIVLMTGLFVHTADIYENCYRKRADKQNLNLSGRLLTSCLTRDEDGVLRADETAFVLRVKEILYSEEFLGCVFVYSDYIVGVDCSGAKTPAVRCADHETESQRIRQVNGIMNLLLPPSSRQARIEIAEELENNELKNLLFHSLDENITVFLILRGKAYFAVSGFSLQFEE